MVTAVKTYFSQLNYALLLKVLLLGILAAILTFPSYELIFSKGIDPSLSWVFNSLFSEGLTDAKNFIFPHGPLAFFMYPLAENIVLVVVVTFLLKILLLLNVKVQLSGNSEKNWLIAFLITYLICLVTGFTHLILANVLLLFVNYYRSNKLSFKYLAFFLVAFAFYVKSYVAILSGMLCASFIIIEFFRGYNWKTALKDTVLIFGFMFLFWLMLFHSFSGFFRSIYGMIQLAGDNSSAVAYYPVNNWWYLTLFFVGLIALIPLNRNKDSYYYFALIALSIFGAWKHAIARQDSSHMDGMWSYLIIVLGIFILFYPKNRLQNTIISVVVLVFFSANMTNAEGYHPAKFELFKANNFFEFARNFDKKIEDAKKITQKNITENKLPSSIRSEIGDKTVDIYPWDYSIIPANDLNWEPRVVLHSYAAYTSWLDKQNANYIQSNSAAEYLIWKIEKDKPGLNGNLWNSIDNRYLLNDEPQFILAFLSHYHPLKKENGFLLFKKNVHPKKVEKKTVESTLTIWDNWLKVPSVNNSILRAKVKIQKSFLLKLKSTFYKDEQYWIDLKFKDKSIHHYRFVPKNAADGLWINPYFYDLKIKKEVEQIRFRTSNSEILSSEIKVDWEEVNIAEIEDISKYFLIDSRQKHTLVDYVFHDFSKNNFKRLKSNKQIKQLEIVEGEYQQLDTNEMSNILSLKLDSLTGSFNTTFGCHIKAENYHYTDKILIVIAIDKDNVNLMWKGVPVDNQLISRDKYNWVINNHRFVAHEPGYEINVSIWNTSKDSIQVDDFKLHLYREE